MPTTLVVGLTILPAREFKDHYSGLCASESRYKYTMFVQVFETFSALNDFWLTTPSNPLEFLTAQSSSFSSIQISTFFCCKCIVFAVRGVPMLRVQEYQEIETHVMLGNDDFGWWMMTIWQVNVTQMSHFSSCLEAKFGLLPFLNTALHLTIYKFVSDLKHVI